MGHYLHSKNWDEKCLNETAVVPLYDMEAYHFC